MRKDEIKKPKIGIVTSGGDSQGMNAAIRASIRTSIAFGFTPYLIHEGYKGLIEDPESNIVEAGWDDVPRISVSGTAIGSARCSEAMTDNGKEKLVRNLVKNRICSLIVIGGDGSLTGADIFRKKWNEIKNKLIKKGEITKEESEECPKLSVCAIVGSIDNDMCGTDITLGAFSALNRIVELVDIISSTASSHQRAFVIKVMGRNCGWLALMSSIAVEADWFFIPESPPRAGKWQEKFKISIEKNRKLKQRVTIVIVSEGAIDDEGNPINPEMVKKVLDDMNIDTRISTLGHLQRGGSPSCYDRIIGTLQGVQAVVEIYKMTNERMEEEEPVVLAVRNFELYKVSLKKSIEYTKKASELILQKKYSDAFNLRGKIFSRFYEIATRKITVPTIQTDQERSMKFGILCVGSPVCGINGFIHNFVRFSSRKENQIIGFYDGFLGFVSGKKEKIQILNWANVERMTSESGSIIRASTYIPKDKDLPMIEKSIKDNQIDGIIIIGDHNAIIATDFLRKKFINNKNLNIPILCIPATTLNNIPFVRESIGYNSTLDAICQITDAIRRSASTTKRVFVVEIQSGECGFLTTIGAIISGAAFAYGPHIKIDTEIVGNCAKYMVKRFEENDKSGRIILISDNRKDAFKPIIFSKILADQSNGIFDSKASIPGHIIEGSLPNGYDRVLSAVYASVAYSRIVELLNNNQVAFELVSTGYSPDKTSFTSIEDVINEINSHKKQSSMNAWWKHFDSLINLLSKQPYESSEFKKATNLKVLNIDEILGISSDS